MSCFLRRKDFFPFENGKNLAQKENPCYPHLSGSWVQEYETEVKQIWVPSLLLHSVKCTYCFGIYCYKRMLYKLFIRIRKDTF